MLTRNLKVKILSALYENRFSDGFVSLISIIPAKELPKGLRIEYTDNLEKEGLISYSPNGKSFSKITPKGIFIYEKMIAEAEKLKQE